jgi:hypothetical protein
MQDASKVWDWGKRYDIGEMYGVPALVGHEFALVSSGIRGGRVNYFPPADCGIQCEGTAASAVVAPSREDGRPSGPTHNSGMGF